MEIKSYSSWLNTSPDWRSRTYRNLIVKCFLTGWWNTNCNKQFFPELSTFEDLVSGKKVFLTNHHSSPISHLLYLSWKVIYCMYPQYCIMIRTAFWNGTPTAKQNWRKLMHGDKWPITCRVNESFLFYVQDTIT